MNKIFAYAIGIGAFLVAYFIGSSQPAIMLQWAVAAIAYWLGDKIFKSKLKPESSKDKSRAKLAWILGFIGLLGILSPILGFIFALPAFLISKSVTDKYQGKTKLVYFAGAVALVCLLNANLGSYLYSMGSANYSF